MRFDSRGVDYPVNSDTTTPFDVEASEYRTSGEPRFHGLAPIDKSGSIHFFERAVAAARARREQQGEVVDDKENK